MSSKLIDTISLPAGLRALSTDELAQASEELRDELIDAISEVGGHFASSLGAAEITVALHHCFETPKDKIVWDVGHQAYIHKMLTGRRDKLSTIRRLGGISGFLKRSESEFDTFGAGHAGTSISAAVGMKVALQKADPDRYVVAVIGDGSITAGMAFEALNHAGALGLKRFIVLINDNEMSISPNVGALSWLFSRAVTSKASTFARRHFKRLYHAGYVPDIVYRAIDKAEEAAQGFFATPAMLFESFGFRYIGPIDGHNIADLVNTIENAKAQDVPVVIHAATVKGWGYNAAEEDPLKWHGVVPFNREKAEFHPSSGKTPPSYTGVFADTLIEICKKDEKVVGITAAMPSGTGLDKLQKEVPSAFFDVGICEQHAVTFAAGLACEGIKPVVAIYSTFLQRAYDQVVHDVCVQNLPVVFAMDRGGVVGNDGETHQGVFDIGYLRTLPHMVIMSPKDENELRHMVFTGVKHNGPIALRYPRGNGVGAPQDAELKALPIGKGEILRRGERLLLIAFGPFAYTALKISDEIEKIYGHPCTVINARFAKPLDEKLILGEASKHEFVYSIEDHALMGGFGSALLECFNDSGATLVNSLRRFGVLDEFVPHGSQSEQYQMNRYSFSEVLKATAEDLGEPARKAIHA